MYYLIVSSLKVSTKIKVSTGLCSLKDSRKVSFSLTSAASRGTYFDSWSSCAGSWGPHCRDPVTRTPHSLTQSSSGQGEVPTFTDMGLSKARSPPPLPPYTSSILGLKNSLHFTDMNRYGHRNAIT